MAPQFRYDPKDHRSPGEKIGFGAVVPGEVYDVPDDQVHLFAGDPDFVRVDAPAPAAAVAVAVTDSPDPPEAGTPTPPPAEPASVPDPPKPPDAKRPGGKHSAREH